MDDVIAQAKKLAQMLASHERATSFRAAAAAVEADPEASRIQRAYAQAIEAVREREVAGQPVEPEHKRALMTAADQVRKSDKLVVMLQAHAAYAEMMETVQAILSGMTEEDGGHEHGPGCDHGHDHGHGGKPEEPPQKSVLWTP
jgi:cell fate (sporulation/competence/biofilm development) regulator YlbF (YheA/YmcA/DUF963 family)